MWKLLVIFIHDCNESLCFTLCSDLCCNEFIFWRIGELRIVLYFLDSELHFLSRTKCRGKLTFYAFNWKCNCTPHSVIRVCFFCAWILHFWKCLRKTKAVNTISNKSRQYLLFVILRTFEVYFENQWLKSGTNEIYCLYFEGKQI